MKIGLCAFSLLKIYPGKGKTFVKADGKSLTFINKKCERSFIMQRNPRKVKWTVLYRRKLKKDFEKEAIKKRTRRNTKHTRAIVGATMADIMAKRDMKPEVRKAQREQAIKAAKDQKKAKTADKKVKVAPSKSKSKPAVRKPLHAVSKQF